MKRYTFASGEIDAHKATQAAWHEFVRRREAEIVFSRLGEPSFPEALELGAGNGWQSRTIARYCGHLVCTEVDPDSYRYLGEGFADQELEHVEYVVCDATDLSRFADGSFDLVFTSNVLEHIDDLDTCLAECSRVLRGDGLMIHSMPSRLLKSVSGVLDLMKLKLPRVHGVSRSHREEYRRWEPARWRARFERLGLVVDDIVGLPFYVGHGNSCIPAIKLGNRLGLSASYAFFVRKGGGGAG